MEGRPVFTSQETPYYSKSPQLSTIYGNPPQWGPYENFGGIRHGNWYGTTNDSK